MRKIRLWNGIKERRLSGICQLSRSEALFNSSQGRELSTLIGLSKSWKKNQFQPQSFFTVRSIPFSNVVDTNSELVAEGDQQISIDENILPELNDKKIPYDEQLKAYSAQGNSRLYLLCAEKLISSLHRPHNQKKYSQYITTEFFFHLMTLVTSNNQEKILEYYGIMTKDLNLIPNKEILYLVIPVQVHQKKISDAIHLLKKEIFRKISYLPKNETESNQLFLTFFEESRQDNNLHTALELYNLLLEQESIHSTQLLTDDIYSTLLEMLAQGTSNNNTNTSLTGNKFEIIEHWISHYRQQNLESPTPSSSTTSGSQAKGGYEYFVNETFEQALQQYLNHFVLKNHSLSLYETYSLGYQFCDLLLSNRIPAYLPILDYLSWLIDNMPVRLQSFVKLVFRYETNDILLFEVISRFCLCSLCSHRLQKICQKYSEKGLDEELAWVVQCMVTDSSSPPPSMPCAISLIELYLRQNNSYEAYDFVDVSPPEVFLITAVAITYHSSSFPSFLPSLLAIHRSFLPKELVL
jgi:hypothetical protein